MFAVSCRLPVRPFVIVDGRRRWSTVAGRSCRVNIYRRNVPRQQCFDAGTVDLITATHTWRSLFLISVDDATLQSGFEVCFVENFRKRLLIGNMTQTVRLLAESAVQGGFLELLSSRLQKSFQQ